MSGLEAIGVAASIIQVADLGAKLSVKLFSFYRQVKNANESMQLLSNEVALTSAILRELGDNLKEKEVSKLCSDEAFQILEVALDQCGDVLEQIEKVLEVNNQRSKSRFKNATGKLILVLREPSLDPLKQNLERLKSTMLLLLNVIMLAGQVRSQKTSTLEDQRVLIETLLQERKEKDEGPKTINTTVKPIVNEESPKPNTQEKGNFPEVNEYNELICKMLREIDLCKSKLESNRHSRIRKGVLGIHDSEILRFQISHGSSVLDQFDKSLINEEHTLEAPQDSAPTSCPSMAEKGRPQVELVIPKPASRIPPPSGPPPLPPPPPRNFHLIDPKLPLSLSLSTGRFTSATYIPGHGIDGTKISTVLDGLSGSTVPNTETKPTTSVMTSEEAKKPIPKPVSEGIESPDIVSGTDDNLHRYFDKFQEKREREQENYSDSHALSASQELSSEKNETRQISWRKAITFDHPQSPSSDEENQGDLVPFRQPPVNRNDSVTLTKVNPLRRSAGQENRQIRLPRASNSESLGAVITRMSKMTGCIGGPAAAVADDSASSGRRSNSGPGSYHGRTPSSGVPASNQTRLEESKDNFNCGDETGSFQGLEAEKSVYRRSSLNDKESDGDLFAIRLKRTKRERAIKKGKGPVLKIDTDTAKTDAFPILVPEADTTFHFPTHDEEACDDPRVFPNDVTSPINRKACADDGGSPFENNSIEDDTWISRPTAEGIIDNLDSFFPNVDLDAPYADKYQFPSDIHNGEHETARRPLETSPIPNLDLSKSSPTDAPTVHQLKSRNAFRKVFVGGNQFQGKSLRQIVGYKAGKTMDVSASGSHDYQNSFRHKDRNMLGAKIIQINPELGTVISNFDPIPRCTSHADYTKVIMQGQPTFRIIRGRCISSGAFGDVYIGMNADSSGQLLAIKEVDTIRRSQEADKDHIKEMVAALHQRITTMPHLEHPNIVQYLGFKKSESSISIYLEYISGGSVGSYLQKRGKFDESVMKFLIRQILSALKYLHSKGISHGDLKADNILLGLDGTCKISNFGVLGSIAKDNVYGNNMINSEHDSIFWMAPEIMQSPSHECSAKGDIWALGCVVLEMFTARRPWSSVAVHTMFKLSDIGQAPPIPDEVSNNCSSKALAFMWDCFAVDPLERPNAGALLSRHPFCEPDPAIHDKSDLFAEFPLYKQVAPDENNEVASDGSHESNTDRDESDGKLTARTNGGDPEASEDLHDTLTPSVEADIVLPETFEQLLLSWTKLGQNEISALENPLYQMTTPVATF